MRIVFAFYKPTHFQARDRMRRSSLALAFLCCSIFVLRMNCAGFSFFSTSQEIGWEERLQDDLFCVEWVRKAQTQYSVTDVVKLNMCITEGWMVHCVLMKRRSITPLPMFALTPCYIY